MEGGEDWRKISHLFASGRDMSLLLTDTRLQDEKVRKLLGREVLFAYVCNRNKTHSLAALDTA